MLLLLFSWFSCSDSFGPSFLASGRSRRKEGIRKGGRNKTGRNKKQESDRKEQEPASSAPPSWPPVAQSLFTYVSFIMCSLDLLVFLFGQLRPLLLGLRVARGLLWLVVFIFIL